MKSELTSCAITPPKSVEAHVFDTLIAIELLYADNAYARFAHELTEAALAQGDYATCSRIKHTTADRVYQVKQRHSGAFNFNELLRTSEIIASMKGKDHRQALLYFQRDCKKKYFGE